MKMKKLNKILSFSVIMVLFMSCNDFLDVELEGEYTSSSFYKTKEHAISAINSTYQITAFNTSNNNVWVFGDVASDDAVKGGNDGDQSDIGFVNDFNVNTDNGAIEALWKHYYEGISRANNVIYYVPNIEMDVDLQAQIIGEAKFLRAYFYYHLSNIFGEIPLKIAPALNTGDLNIPKSTVEEIYIQMEKDLSEAATALPVSYSASEVGRATKGSALGLLAKIYLFQEKWDLALQATNSVGDLGYSLVDNYSQNFNIAFENNQESVFEIQHLGGQVPFVGTYLNQYFSPNIVNGYFFNAPTEDFVNEFEVTVGQVVDPRLDYTVARAGNKWVDGTAFLPEWSPATGFLGKKHVQSISDNPIGDGDLNYTFMRYAEILLIKAEALNELNRSAEALVPLNDVRKRARESYLFDEELPGYGVIPNDLLSDFTNTNQSSVRHAIRHERRVELGMEFHRFYDLMRYGKIYAEQALSDTEFNYTQHRYFPIPQSEIDTNTNI